MQVPFEFGSGNALRYKTRMGITATVFFAFSSTSMVCRDRASPVEKVSTDDRELAFRMLARKRRGEGLKHDVYPAENPT